MREAQQIISLLIGLIALYTISIKLRRNRSSWRFWLPLIVALAVNVIYYLNVIFGTIIGISGDLSATRSLITLLMLLIYARIMPPGVFTFGPGSASPHSRPKPDNET